MGSPVSPWRRTGATKAMLMSASPEARDLYTQAVPSFRMYCTSVKPSLRSNASATYMGAIQMPEICTSLMVVVSGGGSAATGLGRQPSSPADPASVKLPRNLRRLHRRVGWVLIGISLPDAGPCAPGTGDCQPWLSACPQGNAGESNE